VQNFANLQNYRAKSHGGKNEENYRKMQED